MKRFLCIILSILLLAGLCACGKKTAEMVPHAYKDLTISLPADYIDLSDEEFAQGLEFVFGKDPVSFNGIREEKATFAPYGLELDLQKYAKLVVLSNNLSVQPEEKDGILSFTYEAISDGVSYTYVVTAWETEEAFWTVQSYCPTANYAKVKTHIWEILGSVTV